MSDDLFAVFDEEANEAEQVASSVVALGGSTAYSVANKKKELVLCFSCRTHFFALT